MHGSVLPADCHQQLAIRAHHANVYFIKMLDADLGGSVFAWEGLAEHPDASDLVSCHPAFVHHLNQSQQLVLLWKYGSYISNCRSCLLGLFVPLELTLNSYGFDFLLGHEVDDGLLLIGTLVEEIVVVDAKIYEVDTCGDVFFYFV